MHRALRWSYNWTWYLDYNWKVIILGMFKRQSLQQQLARDSIFDLKSKRKPRFLYVSSSPPPPPRYYAYIILLQIVYSADRWSNPNYSFLRTHILEISGTSKRCSALKLGGVRGCIGSAAPWILSQRRERLHTFSYCILLTGNLRYFATNGAKLQSWSTVSTKQVLAVATVLSETARQSVLEIWGKIREFSFPMERFSLSASYSLTHQNLS